mgnify:CR=1 FL=1
MGARRWNTRVIPALMPLCVVLLGACKVKGGSHTTALQPGSMLMYVMEKTESVKCTKFMAWNSTTLGIKSRILAVSESC